MAPPPTNNYDFILNPQKPAKKSNLGDVSSNPFIMKIAFILGGALVVMIILAVTVNLFFSKKTNLEVLVSLAQTEQEVVRISDMSNNATDQTVKNAAINTSVTIKTQQQEWVAFLAKHKRKVETKELSLKRNPATDNKLTLAKQTSTFDTAYTSVMRTQLQAYIAALKTTYQGATSKQERALLGEHYSEAQLLLKQWPS